MPKTSHRRLLAILAAIAITAAIAMITTVAQPPSVEAATTSWPISVNPKQVAGQLLAHPDGAVSVSGCHYRPDPALNHDLTTINASGSTAGVVTSPVDHQIDFCKKWTVTDRGGMTYVVDWQPSSNKNYLVAYRNGSYAWSTNISGNCSSYVGSGKRGMVAGPGGDLYVVLEECNELILVGVTAKGRQKFRHNLGHSQDYGYQRDGQILAYRDGFVVMQNSYHNGRPTFIRYFDFSGRENVSRRYTDTLSPNEVYGEWSISYEGELSIAVNRREGREEPCDVPWLTNRVMVFKPSATINMSSVATEQHCILAGQILALPEGGTALMHHHDESFMAHGVKTPPSPLFLIKGGRLQIVPLPSSVTPKTGDPYQWVQAQVGLGGTIMMHRWAKQPVGTNEKEALVSQWTLVGSSGELLAAYSAESFFDDVQNVQEGDVYGVPDSEAWTVQNGVLYAMACRTSTSTWNCPPGEAKLHKIPFKEAGFEYPRGVINGVKAPKVKTINLVVLGDSYSSGEGVEPFMAGTDWEQNKCHRSEMTYGPLLDRLPSLTVNLQAFVACSGAESKHLVEVNQDNHEPAQIKAITKDTDVVVMTIGGNDVDFNIFASDCTLRGCSENSAQDILNKIETRLGKTLLDRLKAVGERRRAVGSSARIYVMGYPQLIAPKEERKFDAPGCPLFTDAQADRVVKVVDRLNQAVRHQVEQADLNFISTTGDGSPFKGHELCSKNEDPYFHGPRLPKEYSYHPNALGQYAYAVLLLRKGVIK